MHNPFCPGLWRRVVELHRWSTPEIIEFTSDSALIWWGVAFLMPGDGLSAVPSLAFLSGHVSEPLLGSVLTVVGCVQLWAALCRCRPWRRILLLLSCWWWAFLVCAVMFMDGFTPALGSYVPIMFGVFWAQLRVGLWEAGEDQFAAALRGRR